MEVIVGVIFEMGSILLMGIVFFVLYVYGKKLSLIPIDGRSSHSVFSKSTF